MENFIPLYQKCLNLQNASFSRIDHEDATVAVVYKITRPTGPDLILKICDRTHDYLREVYFLKRLEGKLPIPRLIQVVEPDTGLHGAILMECLQGVLLTNTRLTDSLAFETGCALAKLHQNRIAVYGDPVQPAALSSDPKVPFSLKFEEGFAECSHHLPKGLLKQARLYFDRHVRLLDSVDGPCLIHRDFRPGNLIVHEGRLQGIIDWASARFGFAEEDLCSLEHEWSMTPESKMSFFRGYAAIRPIPDYNAILPLLRLSRAFATMGFMIKKHIWDTTHAHVYQSNLRYLESFFSAFGNM